MYHANAEIFNVAMPRWLCINIKFSGWSAVQSFRMKHFKDPFAPSKPHHFHHFSSTTTRYTEFVLDGGNESLHPAFGVFGEEFASSNPQADRRICTKCSTRSCSAAEGWVWN